MTRINDDFLECVIYLYPTTEDARLDSEGLAKIRRLADEAVTRLQPPPEPRAE